MSHQFQLPVTYNGVELLLPSTFIQFGYSYKIEVTVNSILLSFEKDDEGSWRALTNVSTINQIISKELISAIVESLDAITQ